MRTHSAITSPRAAGEFDLEAQTFLPPPGSAPLDPQSRAFDTVIEMRAMPPTALEHALRTAPRQPTPGLRAVNALLARTEPRLVRRAPRNTRILHMASLTVGFGSIGFSLQSIQISPMTSIILMLTGLLLVALTLRNMDTSPLAATRQWQDDRAIHEARYRVRNCLMAMAKGEYAALPEITFHPVAENLARQDSPWRTRVLAAHRAALAELQAAAFTYEARLSEPPPGKRAMPDGDYLRSVNTAMFLHQHGVPYIAALHVLSGEDTSALTAVTASPWA